MPLNLVRGTHGCKHCGYRLARKGWRSAVIPTVPTEYRLAGYSPEGVETRFATLWGDVDGDGQPEWVVGCYLHVHSFDRPFDHPDYYPFYALCGEVGVPMAMQAGTSGGLMPSECGRPIGIDRPAIYFRDTNFLLSHTGWPWVDETIAMALKFPNVYLGTGAYPPLYLYFLRPCCEGAPDYKYPECCSAKGYGHCGGTGCAAGH